MRNNLLFFIPTYNEKENVELIFSQISKLGLSCDILFIDDNSPDGTAKKLEEITKDNQNVFVLYRDKKYGIGSAHKEGILWAYKNQYEQLITLDCDLTHSPDDVVKFLNKSKDSDIIVGSRFINKKSLNSWNFYRKFLTHLGHFFSKLILGINYDTTGAFRLYNIKKISKLFLNNIDSVGYSFFFESLYVLHVNGYKIEEVSIDLPARVYGHSKMSFKDATKSFLKLIHCKLKSLISYEKLIIDIPINDDQLDSSLNDPQGWSHYWSNKKQKSTFLVYNFVAVIYRKFLFKPNLNKLINKYFQSKSELLHAGCGSGQVDIDISKTMNISALDISPVALSIYKKTNKNFKKIIHGSILNLPLKDKSYDGVYNLGVMEHFTEEEIKKIFKEFNRVLKKEGKIILFWPPEYGTSVIFFKMVHFLLKKVLKKNISFHPAEVTRYKSRQQIKRLLDYTGFKLNTTSFNIKDFFTCVIVVATKEKEIEY